MAFAQGDIVVALDPHKEDSTASRPFVIVSTHTHPFYAKQYIGVAVTTRCREAAVKITNSALSEGRLHETSYVNPWSLSVVDSADIGQYIGSLDDPTTHDIIDNVENMIAFQPGFSDKYD